MGRRLNALLVNRQARRIAGVAALAILIGGGTALGVTKGERLSALWTELTDARDGIANALGFRIETVSITGRKHLSEAEVRAAAGVTPRASLLFLDVAAARAKLKADPWIADAEVRKFYPGRLNIIIRERAAYALWQHGGKISVIAIDGTELGPLTDRRLVTLPLVVGVGAESRAHDFLDLLGRYPDIRAQVRASILVAERRWNLKLKNGIDVRLPERDPAAALSLLSELDRDKKLLTRDITAVDLRIPDRVVVRLSDEAAKAREEMLKTKKTKRKGGDA